jgi:para-aminobenzoate synthetase component 1
MAKLWNGPDILTCAEGLVDKSFTLFFDSNRPSHPLSRWSFLCWDPVEIISCKNNIIYHSEKKVTETNFFDFLQTRLNHYSFEENDIPFCGGAAGYFGYDLGRQLEIIPTHTVDDLNLPDVAIGIYQNILAHDHRKNETWLIGEEPEVHKVCNSYQRQDIKWSTQKTDNEYCDDIQKVIDYIYAGEVYQVNLSRRYEADMPDGFSEFSHYKKLRNINSAPFSAYMNFGDFKLASCSPERFLSVQDKIVETKPIKGTLPDTENADLLQKNIKERAENLMIVDLLRNDISKTCGQNSVTVPTLCDIETFEGLHHMVSTVRGILEENKTAIDLLHGCFPGGSITGAPKIRAMEIIEELEETRRGPYCGAMGYIGFNGNMDTNIIIRTLIYKDNKAFLQVGSGIVSDSVPEKELEETKQKANKIWESFE